MTTTTALQVVTGSGDGAAPLANVLQIAGGMNGGGASFCAVTGDGGVWCWGYNPSALLGYNDADRESYARPVLQRLQDEHFTDAVEVQVGFGATCALKSDGSVWCWGDNTYGQLGVSPGTLPVSIFPRCANAARTSNSLGDKPR